MDIVVKAKGPSAIARDLFEKAKAFQEEPMLNGSIQITDDQHDYWWFLEFGTGSEYERGHKEGLIQPAGIQGTNKPFWYIEYKDGRRTRNPGYVPKFPNRRRRVAFQIAGRTVYALVVEHPGAEGANRGRGIVRLAMRRAQIDLQKELKALRKKRNSKGFPIVPTPAQFARAVNKILKAAVDNIKRLTPVSDDPRHSRLRDAWTYRPVAIKK